MRLLVACALLAAGCGEAARPPLRAGSPVPEVTDPAPPRQQLLGVFGGTVIDNDGDGAYIDRCADTVEDHDGYLDDDGCADPDNDGDGLVDERDACPDRAEDGLGKQTYDGCPDSSLAVACASSGLWDCRVSALDGRLVCGQRCVSPR